MRFLIVVLFVGTLQVRLASGQSRYDACKADFLNPPVEKCLTGPLFWLHGEPDSVLKNHVDRIAASGSGNFTIESRPHPDWLGSGWYDDCKVILDHAKTKGMGAFIFDEKWWPSFDVAGQVPSEHRARVLKCSEVSVTGPVAYTASGHNGATYVKTLAARFSGNGSGNLALGYTINSSTVYGTGYEATMANDGNQSTRWNADANANGNEWLEIDFGTNITFDRTVISESFGRITSYAIQYWNGSSWSQAVSGTTIGDSKTNTFPAVISSKVRLYITTATATPSINEFEVYSGRNYLDGTTLIDLGSHIVNGNLSWSVPAGTWKVLKFTWDYQGSRLLDLTTQSAADWFVNNVVKPHYDHTGATNILGFFYDEPEYYGTWGLGMENDSPHWKEMMASRFYALAGEDQQKATYEYWETLGERLGRVGYGTYRNYVNSKGGLLTGHGNEENAYWMGAQWKNGDRTPLSHGWGQLNMMEVQKYQDIPGIDMLGGQIAVRDNRYWTYQLPKLVSSIAITNDLPNHYAMNEIFGVAGELNYQSRKWWADWCQVHGCNFMIPHAINPKGSTSDPDADCPPFYMYTGDEANWPAYTAWCERQNRLSYMLSGNDSANYSIAPVAVLWPGYSKYVDSTWNDDNCYPYPLQTALDRVHYDNNLLTYNRFESTAVLNAVNRQIDLYKSKYKVLILPPVQHIPCATLNKVKQFYDMGGTVIAWQRVPTRSAKFGNTDNEIQAISTMLWNSLTPSTSTMPITTNANGGKTYFIAAADENTITANLRSILNNAGITSDLQILSGSFDAFTGYNHRKKDGMDVFMVWNGTAAAADITARFQASGEPELWNPTTKAIADLNYTRNSLNEVDVSLTIRAEESYLVVFKPTTVNTRPAHAMADQASLLINTALPNLVSRSAKLRFTVRKRQLVTVSVYSAAGREVAMLVNNELSPGTHTVLFNAQRYANGVYYYRVVAADTKIKGRLIVLKR